MTGPDASAPAGTTPGPTRATVADSSWWVHSLTSGAPGIALQHIERAQAGTGSWGAVQQWATAMTTRPVSAHPRESTLFQGAPAVAFALRAAGRREYAPALATLDDHVTTIIRARLDSAHRRIDSGQPPQVDEFDLISGLTGFGAYLLHRDHEEPAGQRELLHDVLAYLIRLTLPLRDQGQGQGQASGQLPGWWSPQAPGGHRDQDWPGGHANLGLAHGIAGPLALLSIAARRGITVPGAMDAIERLCTVLDRWKVAAGPRAWWPATISRIEWQSGALHQTGPGRPSWCYGTPGLARAQQLAALALNDPARRRLAEDALTACISDQAQLAQLTDTSLCHGWAGLLHATWRVAGDAGPASPLPALVDRLRLLLERAEFHQASPGHDGFLEGASGVSLAQLTATGPPLSGWDTCLLLNA